ncbi:MAG TPA: cupin domain-containing protein [Methanomassiliicoccales archaeon]|jgi:mannose-6-phosphate isomerase-like protein (cupin superfamily)|nr:cupin domain-containing protein [Methanomassiliicoccales archaeon]
MKAAKYTEFPEKDNPHKVSVRMIYDHDHGQAIVISLKRGETLKKHITPVDVMFYILEGTGKVEIGDEIKEVSKDTVIESPARIPHRLFNETSPEFRFLVLKMPKPVNTTKML